MPDSYFDVVLAGSINRWGSSKVPLYVVSGSGTIKPGKRAITGLIGQGSHLWARIIEFWGIYTYVADSVHDSHDLNLYRVPVYHPGYYCFHR